MKRFWLTVTLLISITASSLASAQSYSIRLTYNTNLRASHSLDSPVVARAQAGDVLQVLGKFNRWLEIDRNGESAWLANWVHYTRLDGQQAPPSAEVSANQQQPSNIDNCCFVDRQCVTDQQWADGYWAFQNGQCPTPAQTQPAVSPPATNTSAAVDNCCFLGWQCHNDSDWAAGYFAYQSDQCARGASSLSSSPAVNSNVDLSQIDNCCRYNQQCGNEQDWQRGWLAYQHYQCNVPHPSQGISIQGSPEFVNQVTNALRLLRDRAPEWWKYSTRGLNAIKMIPEGRRSGVWPDTKVYEETLSDVMWGGKGEAGLVYVIFGIVHEACHINEDERYADGLDEEKACVQASQYALQAVNPVEDAGVMAWIQGILDNIHDPEIQWW